MRKTKRRRRGSGTAGIMIIVLAFLVVMTVQICRIRSKDAEYAAKEKELQQQYEEETERSTEIDDLETYILSEVQATCDYIRMIEEGQVVFAGTVEEFDNYIVPNTIFVRLASAPPVDELKMLSGVEDAVSMGGMDYRINFSDSREAITQIVEASVTRNWQLLEIRMEKSSMDSVFSELSAKSKNR